MALNKNELIKRLRAHPMYRDALKMAQTDAERRRIIATCEGFLSQFVDTLTPVAAKIRQDPKVAEQLREAIRTGQVVKESDGKPVKDEPDEGKGEEG